MTPTPSHQSICPLHGRGGDPDALVGRRLDRVVTLWLVSEREPDAGPLDVWLVDDLDGSTRITAGSDWCLTVSAEAPGEGWDMGIWGRMERREGAAGTPFERHLGQRIEKVRERRDPATGRVALEIAFPTGSVHADTWKGDLRLSG
ncbi:hypothetical protein [Nocardiopsis sp. NRRL B-16309]|uniref:hypothetical protein n=1 Tax=Nocardiopsis sp. NRRL B-16309 TaxID=1519494 RepID=UPI0006AF0327|nr:hypothetical protein [Nocardiopsis sp. NRRL B-16309]KOX16691.1 hypothetical protein ADL05_11450 [Nocardiopsis sp. NRRL B-16309]